MTALTGEPDDLVTLLDAALERGRPQLARLADQLDAIVRLRSASFDAMTRTDTSSFRSTDDLLRTARNEQERATLAALVDRMTTTTNVKEPTP